MHSFFRCAGFRTLILVSLALPALFLAGTACQSTSPTTAAKPSPSPAAADEAAAAKKKAPVPNIPDQSGDVAFQSFLGRLRRAVAARDLPAVAEMMTPEFGYLLEPTANDPGSGKGVFAYWDQNNVWPELELVLRERFVPYGSYMVAPPEFALQEGNYRGYRAGMQLVSGGWKFAYFARN